MPLDPDVLADLVVQTIDTALAPYGERLAVAETSLKALQAPPPEEPCDVLAASFAGLLTKELAVLEQALPMQKRVERDAHGQIARVIEEPVS